MKKKRNSFVTQADQLAEQEIIEIIHKNYPSHAILAEESGSQGDNPFLWIIDPLDGTTNFIHGFPHFAVSIALQHKDKLEVAVVYDPLKQEFFSAIRGQGAQLNNRKIRVSATKSLNESLIGTGFPCCHPQHLKAYLRTFETIFPITRDVRRTGSAAIDLAYVAAGRLDGFWEIDLASWDMAAGALLIIEAGGFVGSFEGKQTFLNDGNIIAGNPKIYKNLLKIIQNSLVE